MNFKTAKCDITDEEILLSDGFFVANTTSKDWSFVSINTPENHRDYSISVSSITKSPEAFIDLMAHLGEKIWFDSNKLIIFFIRLRAKDNLFNSL